MEPVVAPFGSWESPITARSLVAGAAGVSEVVVDGEDIWWSESRPEQAGRTTVVRWRAGQIYEPLSADANVRSGVHEYGGGAWWAENQTLWYVDWSDQRLRRLDVADGAGADPLLLTAEPDMTRGLRYADGRPTPDGSWYVCVREVHQPPDADGGAVEPANQLVAVAGDGSGTVNELITSSDFVSSPRISPDGTALAWIQWSHPDMPWDTSELWMASLLDGQIGSPRRIAGGDNESVLEPEWGPDGDLYAVSDSSEWWNLYRWSAAGDFATRDEVIAGEFEIAMPHWVFNEIRYAFTSEGVWSACTANGADVLRLPDGSTTDRWSAVSSLRSAADGSVVFIGARHDAEPAVVRWDGASTAQVIRAGRSHDELGTSAHYFPEPEHITFPVGDGAVAHALFYAPANPRAVGPSGAKPPLLVKAHGGPTSAARSQMQLGLRYWTSRGFAVVDVNYRGSVGYGRSFRHALDRRWGIADVEDCVAAARHLAERGLVDGDRLAIAGGSAGGFTVLAALAFHDAFAVGASSFGIADLEVLVTDTHKFEARYPERLIAPWPEGRAVYAERSPINHTDGFSCPMIILQGGEDKVVPPNQAELMVAALDAKKLPYAYVLFPDEGHGFRKAANIITALESQLSFFGQILGFDPADAIEPVVIANLAEARP